MDTDKTTSKVHQGRNVRRLREAKGYKQEALGVVLNLSQSGVARLEQRQNIDEDTLLKIGEVLEVPVDIIKQLEEDPARVVFDHPTFAEGSTNIVGNDTIGNQYNNPIDRIIELSNEKEALFERLLQLEQQRNAELRQELLSLRDLKEEVSSLKKDLGKQ